MSPKAGQLLLSWDMPSCGQRHGHIINYQYEYWFETSVVIERANTSASYEYEYWFITTDATQTKNTSANEVFLTGLLVDTSYRFRVRACTAEGPGPFSAEYEASAFGPESGILKVPNYIRVLARKCLSYVSFP